MIQHSLTMKNSSGKKPDIFCNYVPRLLALPEEKNQIQYIIILHVH